MLCKQITSFEVFKLIETYEENIDGDKVKVFISIKDGDAHTITIGNNAVSKKSGIQFYVDEHVSLQLDKFDFIMDGLVPTLELREGEELVIPEETEREKEIKRLKKELEQLENAE